MNQLMLDIPREWNRHPVEDIVVTSFDSPAYTSSGINRRLLAEIDDLIGLEMLLNRVELLRPPGLPFDNCSQQDQGHKRLRALAPVAGATRW